MSHNVYKIHMGIDKKNYQLRRSKTHIEEQMYWKEKGRRKEKTRIFLMSSNRERKIQTDLEMTWLVLSILLNSPRF